MVSPSTRDGVFVCFAGLHCVGCSHILYTRLSKVMDMSPAFIRVSKSQLRLLLSVDQDGTVRPAYDSSVKQRSDAEIGPTAVVCPVARDFIFPTLHSRDEGMVLSLVGARQEGVSGAGHVV